MRDLLTLVRAWLEAMRPWPPLDDAPFGFVHEKPAPYRDRSGRWL